MSDLLLNVTSVFFFTAIVMNALFYIRMFEEKDYNARRLFIHMRETKRGKSLLTGKVALLKWVLIFSYASTIFINNIDFYYDLIVFIFYLLLSLNLLRKIINKEISFPRFSKIANMVILLSLAVIVILFIFSPVDHFLWMLIIDKLLLVFITLFILLFSLFIDFGQDFTLNRAMKKISNVNRLLTIVVVGSYGRGSTKEFISRILSLNFNVLATHESYGTSIDIAKTINHALTPKKQIFVAEIDDYKKEDVADICALTKPKIVVVCGINEQKLSVFKKMENIIESKMEAVNSLSRDGLVLINGNSKYSENIYKKTRKKKFVYKIKDKGIEADLVATNIKEGKFGVSFNVTVAGKKYKFSNIKLLGRQNIENLLPAIFIGVYAGIDFSKIRTKIEELRPLAGSMQPKRALSNAIFIDDTHNANINSVLRAVSYMKLYRGKKVLVLEPLVELGKNATQAHFDLGVAVGHVADYVFLTNDNYYPAISSGVRESGSKCEVSVASPLKIIKFITRECGKESVVVFEGREAAGALKGIRSEPIY